MLNILHFCPYLFTFNLQKYPYNNLGDIDKEKKKS